MQEEDTDNPIETWEWKWSSDVTIVPNNVGWPSYKYMPDGHISGVKVRKGLGISYNNWYENFKKIV